ncbi:MAG: alcohol dehydrogenase catalytic domain-containing protein [Dehalococcoidales bacterium]
MKGGEKIKAAVYQGVEDIKVEDVPEPEVEPDGVIIKVNACGICGSDVHSYQGGRGAGKIPGHEFSGDIVEIGANITGVEKGDRVVVMSGRGCGQCYWCQQGQWIRCSKMALLGLAFPGAFAEYVSVPNFSMGLYAAKLPESLSYEEGATAEPVSVAWHGVTQVHPQPEDTVVVIGAGFIGLAIIQILKSIGVSQIIVSGRRAKRLQLAKESGADVVVDAAKDDIVPIVEEVTSGKKADIVFDVAGTEGTFQQALQMVHRGGKVDLVGLYGQTIDWRPTFIVSNDITIAGCGLRFDLPGAIDLMQRGKVNAKPLITHQFPLDKVKEAFDTQLGVKDAIKVLVKL